MFLFYTVGLYRYGHIREKHHAFQLSRLVSFCCYIDICQKITINTNRQSNHRLIIKFVWVLIQKIFSLHSWCNNSPLYTYFDVLVCILFFNVNLIFFRITTACCRRFGWWGGKRIAPFWTRLNVRVTNYFCSLTDKTKSKRISLFSKVKLILKRTKILSRTTNQVVLSF